MTEPQNGSLSIGQRAARIRMLQRASEFVGPVQLADALGLQPRSLRAKLSVDRGVSNDDLRWAAAAMERRIEEIQAQVRDIREAI